MWNLCISSCEDGWGNRLGMSADVQASQPDSTEHAQRLFLPKWKADECDIILWCHCCTAYINKGGYKRMSPRSSGSYPGWFIWWVLVWEATDPLSLLPRCLSRSGIITIQGSVLHLFISSICVHGYLGHSKLVCFSCLWTSWVAHHPVSIKPSIGEARTTALWSWVAHTG